MGQSNIHSVDISTWDVEGRMNKTRIWVVNILNGIQEIIQIRKFHKRSVNASEDTKTRAVYTYFWLNKTQEEVAFFFNVKQSTISRWISSAFEDKDSYKTSGNVGVLDSDDKSFIKSVLDADPPLYLREIVGLISIHRNKDVSVSTIQRAIASLNYTRKRCVALVRRARIQLITKFECMWNNRVGIVIQSQLVFIDEVSFRIEDYERTYGYSPAGVQIDRELGQMQHFQISLCVAIGMDGFIYCEAQYGHFDRKDFVNFLFGLIQGGYLGAAGATHSKIILDGCRIHIHEAISEGLRKCGIEYFGLPPYCPESNPIELFFGILKRKLRDEFHFQDRANVDHLAFVKRLTESKMYYECRRLFDKAGWRQHRYYRSPYLSNAALFIRLKDSQTTNSRRSLFQ
ncbi:hypothetical protein GEMRC1_004947 [Eukaryota sp. GEM-RC1]